MRTRIRHKTSSNARNLSSASIAISRSEDRTKSNKLKDVFLLAQETGLLTGSRTKVIRGRMPEALVKKAKERTGIQSDTDLLEAALASLAVADDFPEWILSRTGTVSRDLDLEF